MNAYLSMTQLHRINELLLLLCDPTAAFSSDARAFFFGLSRLVDYAKGSLWVYTCNSHGECLPLTDYSFFYNMSSDAVTAYAEKYYKSDCTMNQMAQPHYIRLDMLSHYNSEYLKNVPVYTEYYEKNDLCVGITINLPLNLPGASEVFAMLSIFRGKSGNTFNENDLEILSFFQPHLTKSLHNYMKPIFCKQIAPIESGECFSHIGYCILGEDNRILESSSLFDQMGSNHRQQITRKITDLKYKLNCQPSMATAFCKLDNLPVYLELTKTTFKHMQAYKCIIYNLSAFFHATLQQIKITYSLSDREYSIMELLLKGSRINEIATQQFISVSMVKKNIASLCEKLNIDSQKQLLSTLGLF